MTIKNNQLSSPQRLLRLPQVLEILPVSRSHFLDGVNAGKYPAPVKLSDRIVCWRLSDINELIESLGDEQ